MMTVASTTAESETGPLHVSLRERKKLATRRELRRVALRMIAERGYSNVTVEEIAEAANVSPRTFFNYFPTKEAALFGADAELAEATAQRRGPPPGRDPFPGLLAPIPPGVFRSSMSFWASSGGTVPLEHLVD